MAGVFGYRDQAEFQRALNRELGQMATHDRPDPERPEAKSTGFRFRGKPGSPERLQQVAELAGSGNRNLMQQITRDQRGNAILQAVKRVQREPSQESISEAAKLVAESENVHVARAAIQALQATGYVDTFIGQLQDAADQVENAKVENQEAAERKRLAERQKVIAQEYQRVERNPAAVQAVDELAHGLGDLLYDEQLQDDEARVMLRSQAEMAKRQENAHRQFAVHAALHDEFLRYGPGNGANDDDRERYERDLRNSALEVYDRHAPTPERAAEAAMQSVAHDKAFGEKSPLEVALKAEFAEMAKHNSDAPDRSWMSKELAEDFDRRFDESGMPRQ